MKNYNTVAKWIWKNGAVNSQTVEVITLKTFEVIHCFFFVNYDNGYWTASNRALLELVPVHNVLISLTIFLEYSLNRSSDFSIRWFYFQLSRRWLMSLWCSPWVDSKIKEEIRSQRWCTCRTTPPDPGNGECRKYPSETN